MADFGEGRDFYNLMHGAQGASFMRQFSGWLDTVNATNITKPIFDGIVKEDDLPKVANTYYNRVIHTNLPSIGGVIIGSYIARNYPEVVADLVGDSEGSLRGTPEEAEYVLGSRYPFFPPVMSTDRDDESRLPKDYLLEFKEGTDRDPREYYHTFLSDDMPTKPTKYTGYSESHILPKFPEDDRNYSESNRSQLPGYPEHIDTASLAGSYSREGVHGELIDAPEDTLHLIYSDHVNEHDVPIPRKLFPLEEYKRRTKNEVLLSGSPRLFEEIPLKLNDLYKKIELDKTIGIEPSSALELARLRGLEAAYDEAHPDSHNNPFRDLADDLESGRAQRDN